MNRRRLLIHFRLYWRRARRYVVHNLLHADDPPHKLALGAAIGVFVTFTPTIGFQMALNVFVAWLLRANKVVGLPIVWLSNPATIVPLYWSCYVVGRVLLGQEKKGFGWWRKLQEPPEGWWPAVTFYWSRLMEIAAPLWLGSIILGLLAGLVSYYVVYFVVRWYRLRRFGQLVPPSAQPLLTATEPAHQAAVRRNRLLPSPTPRQEESGGG